jgi:transposase
MPDEMDASPAYGVAMRQTEIAKPSHSMRRHPVTVSTIGIDLAKNVFQVAGLNRANKIQFNRRFSRKRFPEFMAQQPPTTVAIEATASAHYWGRVLRRMGHDVRLLPPQHVKAFCRVHKSDGHDAVAIAEATQRPEIHPVPIKSIAQQDLQLLHRQRDRLVRRRTQTINQLRGFAREYGVFFSKGKANVMAALPGALEDGENELSMIARSVLADLGGEVRALDQQIEALKQQILSLVEPLDSYKNLLEVPGLGPVVASALVASSVGGSQFRNGRQCAAWLGLVPRQHSSGDRQRLLGITKNGDRVLRTLMIHGARSVIRWAVARKRDDALGRWVRRLVERRGMNCAVVAYANKLTRIAWAMLRYNRSFEMQQAFAG